MLFYVYFTINLLQIWGKKLNLHNAEETHLLQSPCTRTFSTFGSIGCLSDMDGTQGGLLYLYFSNTYILLIWLYFTILSSALINVAEHFPIELIAFNFVAVVPGEYFNSSVINTLLRTNFLQGIIVVDERESAYYLENEGGKYSVDVETPQGIGTLQKPPFDIGSDYLWNLVGNGVMQRLLQIPVVRADYSERDSLLIACKANRVLGYTGIIHIFFLINIFMVYPSLMKCLYFCFHSGSRVNMASLDFYMGKPNVTSIDCLGWTDIDGHRDPQVTARPQY